MFLAYHVSPTSKATASPRATWSPISDVRVPAPNRPILLPELAEHHVTPAHVFRERGTRTDHGRQTLSRLIIIYYSLYS